MARVNAGWRVLFAAARDTWQCVAVRVCLLMQWVPAVKASDVCRLLLGACRHACLGACARACVWRQDGWPCACVGFLDCLVNLLHACWCAVYVHSRQAAKRVGGQQAGRRQAGRARTATGGDACCCCCVWQLLSC